MKRLLILILVVFITNLDKAQYVDGNGLVVSMNGYLFIADGGLFFQPLDITKDKGFVASLNKQSFLIEESELIRYSDVLKGVGYKLAVNKYLEDTVKKNPRFNNNDTITYFKCNINIEMDFFDTSYTSFREIGYSFVLNNQMIYYGNLAIRNQLYKIIPDDVKVLEQFYISYQKKKITPPEWLRTLYVQRKVKRK